MGRIEKFYRVNGLLSWITFLVIILQVEKKGCNRSTIQKLVEAERSSNDGHEVTKQNGFKAERPRK